MKIKGLVLRNAPESVGHWKEIVEKLIETHVDNLRDEINNINEQNRNLKEELQLNSETICKLLDLTTEKNLLIVEIK